ncbi:Tripartite-type tricarboxylate transporter, receptor component TctC [Gemmobacter megaterium]|uniref:Tripartite-type tricarboxylate transporter, receptor component TctC n=1 Tax=Gemmobacter megaterium TaxID=1086013 RepID=A0A1N7N287_9RHOB|nr:tripartite tricarboxylate transporter substrate binding protein [Gemmobacter megaterium]GGE12503.1 ABC transporter substrate-binding protein [Gemmobacter megaterium]SIS92249.1 Tripartite-type tricarboxylate transporter, receptor component TctC [Gemmobacter megaterium]
MTHPFNRRHMLLAGAALAMAAATGSATAQSWPTAPVHIIVGFPAGSSPDTLARLVAEPLAARLGQPVVVENKAGAGGVIGVQQMLLAKDGHTFGATINGPLTTSPRLIKDIGYDVAADITGIALTATSPLVLAVSADNAASTLQDFIAAAKADPGAMTYGSVGQGSGAHLSMELFLDTAGLEMLHVPFTSYAEVTTSIMGAEIDAGFMAPSAAMGHVQAGKMKMLGITSAEPFPQVPDVPVIAGQDGMPADYRAELWNAFIAPAGTDPAVIERLNTEINAILADPTVQERMLAMGWKAEGGSAADLTDRIAADTAVWGRVLDRIAGKQ